ncbi:MAG: hypothetical protein WC205_04230 [Opitutaceae bacterium]
MKITLELGKLKLERDENYGCLKRTGWSFAVDGSYAAELEPWLLVALWKGARRIFRLLPNDQDQTRGGKS